MRVADWNKRFFASTRGRIVSMLRRKSYTVSELAKELALTESAVRAHLSTLERDGLVQQEGTRPAHRKPHHTFRLTPEAEQLFPEGCGPILSLLIDVLLDRDSTKEVEAALRDVGHRTASEYVGGLSGASRPERIQRALKALDDLGGLAEVTEEDGQLFIHGISCPLSFVVKEHPEGCWIAETMLSDILGIPVKELCNREGSPHCRFGIAAEQS
jgi:predicted ArsR family transcriptional regulator